MAHILVDTRVCVCWTALGKKKKKNAKTRKVLKSFESDSLT